MSRWLAVLGVVAFAGTVEPVRAQEFPWCTEFDPFTRNCGFSSYGECSTIAKSLQATCVRNPNYQAASAAPASKATAAHKNAPKPR